MSAALLTVSALATAMISAVSGMGGGVILLGILTFFFPVYVIIPVHGVVQLVSNIMRAWFLRTSVHRRIFYPFLIGIPLGAASSVLLIRKIEYKEFPLILIAILLLYTVFRTGKLPPLKIPFKGFVFIGVFAGFLALLVGSVGPFIMPFLFRSDLRKEEIVSTEAAVQIIIHAVKIPSFLYLGFEFETYAPLIVLLGLVTVIGTRIGVTILSSISPRVFFILLRVILLFAAVRILYKILL